MRQTKRNPTEHAATKPGATRWFLAEIPTAVAMWENPASHLALIVSNVIPLVGVILFHWSLFSVVFLYWLESAIIGFWNIPKMLTIGAASAIPTIVFFMVHYGMFMAVHGVFIFALFGGAFSSPAEAVPGSVDSSSAIGPWAFLTSTPFYVAFASLFISHSVSYFTNFLGHREYENTQIQQQMFSPYQRIIIMHLYIAS